MTEKQYGGASKFGAKDKPINSAKSKTVPKDNNNYQEQEDSPQDEMLELSPEAIKNLQKAGEITKKVREYIKPEIKKGTPLLEIAEKIERKIEELGGKPAFPINLSTNEIAAHSTPSFNDTELARGLLKIDFGVHIDGFVADQSFSLDLENSHSNQNLIKAAEEARDFALNIIKNGTTLREIGKTIDETAKKYGCLPIRNLSGHSMMQYDLHAGITIPNFDNLSSEKIQEGVYAIEPFTTNGSGIVKDGKPSGIYALTGEGNVRDNFARQVMEFIVEEYQTLPFCSRWIYKQFGARGLLALRSAEQAGMLYQYPQLIEKSLSPVAQAEHTIIVLKDKTIVTTK